MGEGAGRAPGPAFPVARSPGGRGWHSPIPAVCDAILAAAVFLLSSASGPVGAGVETGRL